MVHAHNNAESASGFSASWIPAQSRSHVHEVPSSDWSDWSDWSAVGPADSTSTTSPSMASTLASGLASSVASNVAPDHWGSVVSYVAGTAVSLAMGETAVVVKFAFGTGLALGVVIGCAGAKAYTMVAQLGLAVALLAAVWYM